MFDKTVLRRSAGGAPVSVGEIAEALLYYQNVHLILDRPTLSRLLTQIGMERLLRLLQRPNVSAVYCEQSLGTRKDPFGSSEIYSFTAFSFRGHKDVGVLKSRGERLEYILGRHGYEKQVARQLVERFRRLVPFRSFTDDYFIPKGIVNAASNDLHDKAFVHEAIRCAVNGTSLGPSLSGPFKFDLICTDVGFHVFSDLNLDRINELRLTQQPPLEQISFAHYLNEILMARADVALAAHYGGEFYTASVTSQILQLRYKELLTRAGISRDERKQLQEIVLPECRTVQEVIDSGQRSFDEFLGVLEKSKRFREWIQGVGPDEKLVHAYFRDVSAQGWVQRLPTKALRYFLGNALSAISPGIGLAFGATDAFLVDKILGGWRPSHFVNRKLRPFLANPDDFDY